MSSQTRLMWQLWHDKEDVLLSNEKGTQAWSLSVHKNWSSLKSLDLGLKSNSLWSYWSGNMFIKKNHRNCNIYFLLNIWTRYFNISFGRGVGALYNAGNIATRLFFLMFKVLYFLFVIFTLLIKLNSNWHIPIRPTLTRSLPPVAPPGLIIDFLV